MILRAEVLLLLLALAAPAGARVLVTGEVRADNAENIITPPADSSPLVLRYYVPEGEGLEIQNDMNARSFGILVALAADGTPQIKALMDGDTRVYEEPPY